MTRGNLTILACAVRFVTGPAHAQTRPRLSTIIPGTERGQLVYTVAERSSVVRLACCVPAIH